MGERRVEETIMKYTTVMFYDGDTLVGEERKHDDWAYDVVETREPTDDEIAGYYPDEEADQ